MARERKFTKTDLFRVTREILLANGYDGFNYGLLANQLDVSRGTIYKYYENKGELLTDYMIYEMDLFLTDLGQKDQSRPFDKQFDHVLAVMYQHNEIREYLFTINKLLNDDNDKIVQNRKHLRNQHQIMYDWLLSFIHTGKKEGKIKENLQDQLLLSMLLQSIETIHYVDYQKDEWIQAIKDILGTGMLTTEQQKISQ